MVEKVFMLGTRVKMVRKDKEGKHLTGKITDFIKDKNENIVKYTVQLDDGGSLICRLDDVVKEEDP